MGVEVRDVEGMRSGFGWFGLVNGMMLGLDVQGER